MRQSYVTQPERYDFWCRWEDDRMPRSERDQIRDKIGMPIQSGTARIVTIRQARSIQDCVKLIGFCDVHWQAALISGDST